MQFGTVGQAENHDRFGLGYIVQQPNPSSLMMQFGDGDNATLTTVDASNVQGTAASTVIEGAAGSSQYLRKSSRQAARWLDSPALGHARAYLCHSQAHHESSA